MTAWIDKTDNWLGSGTRKKKNLVKKIDVDEEVKNQTGVPYYVLKCPQCNSSRCRCYSSNPPIRYHKCGDCGYNFKSVEQNFN